MERIHPSWCFISVVAGIITGMILAVLVGASFRVGIEWGIVAGLLLLITMLRPTRLMVGLMFGLGLVIAQYRVGFDLMGQQYLSRLTGKAVLLTGTVLEDPDVAETRMAVRLGDLRLGGQAVSGNVYAQIADEVKIERSDVVTLQGELSQGFGTFAGTLYRPTVRKLERPEPGDLLLQLRNAFATQVKHQVATPAADLGLGYLLGVRGSLPKDLSETLKVVGLTHIIVASGANLSILIRFARKLFGKISRWCGCLMAMLMVILFAGMIGLTPSMTRAALVSMLSLIAWYVGRKFAALRLLMIVAAVTLLYNPMYLLDLGWLLSFAAFMGIMVLGPWLTQFLYGSKRPNFLVAILIETVAASLLCVPLLLYTFGMFSLISLVANLLILPTIPCAMALVFGTGLAEMLWPDLAALIGKLANWLLDWHIKIINYLGEQTAFLITIEKGEARVWWLYLPVLGLVLYATIRAWKLRAQRSSWNTDETWLAG